MFQYAAARSLAARVGTDVVFDSNWVRGKHGGIPGAERRYELACFGLGVRVAPVQRSGRLPPRTRLEDRLRRVMPRRGRPDLNTIIEDDASIPDPRFFAAGDNTYLDGFWQSYQYFVGAEELLRADFCFRTRPAGDNAALAETVTGTPSVSVHVRRGDYAVAGETRDVAGVLSRRWYQAALDLIAERAGDFSVFVFSDEPEWCAANLTFCQPTTFVSGNTGKTSFEDMRLMSLCRHHVIANSTFSWWGAWLDSNPDKIVIAPDPWRLDRPTPWVYPRGAVRLPR